MANIVKHNDVKYIEEQINLLKQKFNLPSTMVETHEVRQEGKYFILSKRENPIKIYDYDPSGHTASIVQSQKLYTDRMFGDKRRGKYNDAQRLPESLSITVGEVEDIINHF